MKIISWNVNGINACAKKGLLNFIIKENADIYCLQEVKVSEKTIDKRLLDIPGYDLEWNQAEKKGYSGVLCYYKEDLNLNQQNFTKGMNIQEFDREGRVITVNMEDFFLINCYFPNAQRQLTRMDFKLTFNEELMKMCEKLRQEKNVIITGDFNVSHQEIDLKNPKSNKKNAGFTQEERDSFTEFLNLGYIDTFRNQHPGEEGCYTWWSYRNNARPRNIGWRLDYFLTNTEFLSHVKKSEILPEILGSDHCPIRLILN